MRPDSFWENGAPLAFNEARYSGLSAGIPGTPATWEHALKRYGTWSLGRALQPGIRVARDGFKVDQTFVDQTDAQRRLVQRHPLHRRDLPRPRRHAARRGLDAPEPGPRAHLPAAGARGSRRLLPRRAGERDGRGLAAPAQGGRRQPRLAPGPDDDRRPAPLPRDRARARPATGYRGLDIWGMGPPSSGGSTVGEALNILEGYQGLAADRVRALHLLLEASRFTFADRNAYLADPDFFKVPLAGLLSDSFAAERRALINGARPPRARWPPATPTTTRRAEGQAPPRQRHDQPPAPVHHPPRGLGPQGATSCPTRSRSSRPAATRSSCRATASS